MACVSVAKDPIVVPGAHMSVSKSCHQTLRESTCCRVLELAHECDAMLVVGSSLMVYSAFRLAKAAKAGDGRLALLSAGPTRADSLADLKVQYILQVSRQLTTARPSCMLRPLQTCGSSDTLVVKIP